MSKRAPNIPFEPISDIFFDYLDGISEQEESYVDSAMYEMHRAAIGTFPTAVENITVAMDRNKRPGILLLGIFRDDPPPNPHQIVKMVQSIQAPDCLPDASIHVVMDHTPRGHFEGPGLAIFVPGVEHIDPKIEVALSYVWDKSKI